MPKQKAFHACSVRFVPDQRPEDLVAKLTSHVVAKFAALMSSNNVSVRVKSVGDWWEADPQSKLFKLAENALYQVRPHLIRQKVWDSCLPSSLSS